MTKQRDLNKQIVKDIQARLEEATSVVVTDYRGLNVAEATDLRRQLREAGVEYRVLKNTLTRLAASEAGLEGLHETLSGPNAIAFSSDAVSAAKVLYGYAKKNDKLEIKGGALDGQVVSLDQLKALSELPSREELLTKLAGCLQGPMSNMVNVLQAPLRDCVGLMQAIKDKKEADA